MSSRRSASTFLGPATTAEKRPADSRARTSSGSSMLAGGAAHSLLEKKLSSEGRCTYTIRADS